jgi:hypothetical protein
LENEIASGSALTNLKTRVRGFDQILQGIASRPRLASYGNASGNCGR